MDAQEKKRWLKEQIGCLPVDEAKAVEHYYLAMHDFGMGLTDADDYAWLNTLVGYNIGPDYALGIIRHLYETLDTTVQEVVTAANKALLQGTCRKLGYKIDFSNWPEKDPECIRYDWKENTVEVQLYCSSTGLFTEEECEEEPLTDMLFPEWIVRKWFSETVVHENSKERFEAWFENYTANSTDGLYDYALDQGYIPSFGFEAPDSVVTEDGTVVFTGSYDECRRYGRDRWWEADGEGLRMLDP